MNRSFPLIFSLIFVAGVSASHGAEDEKEIPLDPETGIKMAENWELVRVHCVVCHSPQQFLRQRGTEATWTGIIQWMQKSGGLWKLDVETEKKIISYLATNYQPDPTNYRRAPIPATMMPKNPYESAITREVEAKKKAGLIPKGPVKP